MTETVKGKKSADNLPFSGEMTRRGLAKIPLGFAVLGGAAATAAHAHEPEARPTLEQRAAIDDLFTNYVWAYDCNDVATFLSLFVDKDPLIMGLGKPHRGKPALGAWFKYLMEIRNREDDLWLHQAAHHIYRKNGNGWLVYSYATHFNYDQADKTYGVRSLGYFVSELVPAGQGYLFRRFSITHWDRDTVPWSKPLPWADVDAGAGKLNG